MNAKCLKVFKQSTYLGITRIFPLYFSTHFLIIFFLDSLIQVLNKIFGILITFYNKKIEHKHFTKWYLILFDSTSVTPPYRDRASVPQELIALGICIFLLSLS